jgi:hypothetical protein
LNLHQMPEAVALHRSLWAGRIMSVCRYRSGSRRHHSAFRAGTDREHVAGNWVRDGPDPCRGPIILACAILYAIPATAVLGAILATGFLGGAICAHVRIGELGSPPEIISLLLGAMTWGALYTRNPRIRAVLPLIR